MIGKRQILKRERDLLGSLGVEECLDNIRKQLGEDYSVMWRTNLVDELTALAIVKSLPGDECVPEYCIPVFGITATSDNKVRVDDPCCRPREHFMLTNWPWETKSSVYGRKPIVLSGDYLTRENLQRALCEVVEERKEMVDWGQIILNYT